MIARTILAALLALASVCALTAAAQGADAARVFPALKRSAVVSEKLVRIGDVIDNAGALAQVPIFRAPDVGTTGAVPTARVLDALRSHDLFAVDIGDITEVEVTRAGRWIPAAEIEAAIARAFAGQHGLGEARTLALTFDREVRAISVEAGAELQIARASFDPRTGRFDVSAEFPGSELARRLPLRFTGSLAQTVEVAVLTRSLARGELVKAADVTMEKRAKSEAMAEIAGPADKLAGLAARQALRAGQPVRRADLVKPDMVKRDDTVTLVYEVPGIVLTTRAKALESGAEGDVVSVLNTQSKRTMQGVVTAPGRVTMTSAAPRILAAVVPTGSPASNEDARAPSE